MKKSYLLRGCMKLNDNSVFQNGSLGERTSLLTSLLRWSFFARSLWLLMAAPMAPEILKMVKILSKSWVTSNFLQLKIKFLQQKHIFIFHTDRVHPSFISGLEVSRFVISWLFFIALFCTLCWSGTYWLSLMTVPLICLTQSHCPSWHTASDQIFPWSWSALSASSWHWDPRCLQDWRRAERWPANMKISIRTKASWESVQTVGRKTTGDFYFR